jgi:hypothetical protein
MEDKELDLAIFLDCSQDKIPDDNELSVMILKIMELMPKDFKPGVGSIILNMLLMFGVLCSPSIINRLINEHPLLSDFSI